MNKSKMYILVKKSLSHGHKALTCAHASLACYLNFKNDEEVQKWLKESFRKVVVEVGDEDFERAKTYGEAGTDYIVMHESSLDGMETSVVFKPKENWDSFFKSLKLYKGD